MASYVLTTIRLSLVATALLFGAGDAVAADLAGTSWNTSGKVTIKTAFRGKTDLQRRLLLLVVQFDPAGTPSGGNCTLLLVPDGVPLDGTWSSRSAKRFTMNVSAEPFRAAWESFLVATYGPGVRVSMAVKPISGTIKARQQAISFGFTVVGEATIPGSSKPMRIKYNSTMVGPPTMSPAAFPSEPDREKKMPAGWFTTRVEELQR